MKFRNKDAELAYLKLEVKELEAKLDVYEGIVNESEGVIGWHLNGDYATWNELLSNTPAAIGEQE